MIKIKLKIGTLDGREHNVIYEQKGNTIESALLEIYPRLKDEIKINTFKLEENNNEFISIETNKMTYIKFKGI